MPLPAIPVPTEHEAERITVGLGLLSLAIAALELAKPGALARSIGLRQDHAFLKGLGMREMATGTGLLNWKRGRARPFLVWARVAGDAMDLAALAPALSRRNPRRRAAAAAVAVVAAVTVIDILCARALSKR
ncbi:hypothetical protein [Hansschlegelia plantiphila]|uniref:Uncharacterized protein n=1 Tax=Hansschlegelia plantiphila TaxID=374655 RepID=A0A9W6IZ28_9HYPH|nr:hypothetical protein [Hansschlegelia plantiphila]GLK67667.1 hypothetical protein GCM10008179_13050 [Hansschlegelia plantiphila]